MNPRLGEAVRVGEPESLVKPGDPVPGKPGHYYEAGQYAPSPERLSALKIQETVRAGLLPTVLEDKELSKLFSKNGEVNTQRLKKFDFSPWLKKYGFTDIDYDLPGFAALVLISTLMIFPSSAFAKYVEFKRLVWVSAIEEIPEDLEEQRAVLAQNVSLSRRTLILGSSVQEGKKALVLFQPFFVYMSVPILPGVPGITSGLSITTAAIMKIYGRETYRRLKRKNKSLYFEFLEIAGWKKKDEILTEEAPYYISAGRELGLKRKTKWARDTRKEPISSNAVISPLETFTEGYLYYWTHRLYLEKVSPELHEFFERLEEYIKDVVGEQRCSYT